MPGENSNAGLGDYTAVELSQMTPADFAAAQQRGFTKPLVSSPLADVQAAQDARTALAELQSQAAGIQIGSSVPGRNTQPQDGANVWGSKASGEELTVPSGQKCRMRPLQLEQLLLEGILDHVTRLDGLAQTLVNQAEGLPPEKQQMPTAEDFATLLNLVNKITRLAVAEPPVFEDNDPTAPAGAIRVSDIDLMDRIAILEHALKGVKGLDNFRNAR